ncbi:GIY-YIG nuclease family protein [Luteimonas kalidii]|uniref:GIY-YIG nuclease family protein n=1 Tax=Luteimonas kalidii TaxID=3042025 RepID=A0ABT6JZ53_9GAMM|nr:GIY-YIG nuclease family protein [Luteimonas kalidii]MDH5835326.1 GIY-YIG nuclease family protein [Luteimonas kalidii]
MREAPLFRKTKMRSRTCYLYVLPLAYEDQLKLGISHDPLARAQAFSRRYYEFFDLSRSLLVEFDSRREAQARETELHRQLRDWNAVQPITVPGVAAGKTEWYRGAYDILETATGDELAGGHIAHTPATAWWKARLEDERETLFEWTLLADVLDAYAALGVSLPDVLPSIARGNNQSEPERWLTALVNSDAAGHVQLSRNAGD